jgi:hypothetical protein
MLSFELSVIDIVLAIAIIVILLLQVKRTSTESTAQPEVSFGKRKSLESLKRKNMTRKASGMKEFPDHIPKDSADCPHRFGYLNMLPLGSSIPEKCYSCSRMRECLMANEQCARTSR